MKTILVVEDDKNTNTVITEFLKSNGLDVIAVFDGNEAIEKFRTNHIDLCVLDIMLPKKNGIEVLQEIRSVSDIPVVILTALDDEYTQLVSFQNLTDEYVTKPFSPTVLVKRIEALLRRTYPDTLESIYIGDIYLNFCSYKAIKNGESVDFTTKEFELLKVLYQNKGRVLSRQQMLDKVWGYDYVSFDRTVDTHIKNIRKKLESDCIVTVKNVGYKLEV